MKRTVMERKLWTTGDFKTQLRATNQVMAKTAFDGLKKKARGNSTRRIGDDMEAQILEDFVEIGCDFQQTRNSGATHMDGDFKGHGLIIECKKKNAKAHTVRHDEWEAVKSKALKRNLEPVMITENEDQERLVHIRYQDYLVMLEDRYGRSRRSP